MSTQTISIAATDNVIQEGVTTAATTVYTRYAINLDSLPSWHDGITVDTYQFMKLTYNGKYYVLSPTDLQNLVTANGISGSGS